MIILSGLIKQGRRSEETLKAINLILNGLDEGTLLEGYNFVELNKVIDGHFSITPERVTFPDTTKTWDFVEEQGSVVLFGKRQGIHKKFQNDECTPSSTENMGSELVLIPIEPQGNNVYDAKFTCRAPELLGQLR